MVKNVDNIIKEKLVDLTEALIRFKSDKDTPDERKKCLDYIEGYLRKGCKAQFKAERIESNGILSLYIYNPDAKIRKQKEILLAGHIDVIGARPEEFVPRHDKVNVYGRGSGDMKSGVAVMLELFIKHAEKKNISLLLTGDEEIGGMNGTNVAAEKIKPSVVLIPEPTDSFLVIKEKGGIWVDISVDGPGGHASRPWIARNAIDVLTEIITEMRKHFLTARKEGWVDTLSIGAFEGGSLDVKEGRVVKGAGNVIAKHASARVDIRLTEKTSHDKAYRIIDRILAAKLKEIGPGYRIEKSGATWVEHLNTPENLPEVKGMARAYEKAFGKKPKIVGEHGASDGRFFSSKGIPAILFGCVSVGYHSTDERAEIESILKCFEVMDNYISAAK